MEIVLKIGNWSYFPFPNACIPPISDISVLPRDSNSVFAILSSLYFVMRQAAKICTQKRKENIEQS